MNTLHPRINHLINLMFENVSRTRVERFNFSTALQHSKRFGLATASSEQRKLTGTLDIEATTSPVSIIFNPNKVKNQIHAHKCEENEKASEKRKKKKMPANAGDLKLMQLARFFIANFVCTSKQLLLRYCQL